MQCTATSKQSGERCKRPASPGKEVCYIHGGKTPSGIASPHFKSGRYSKSLPGRILERYTEFLSDENILALDDEIALVSARIAELLGNLEHGDLGARWLELQKHYELMVQAVASQDLGAGRAAFEALGAVIKEGADEFLSWSQISELLESRRKLVDTERKRLVDAQQVITSEQAMVLVTALIDSVRRNVRDPATLTSIQADLTRVLNQPANRRSDAD